MDSAPTPSLSIENQIDAYVRAGYPALAGLDEAGFRRLAAPLVDVAAGRTDALLVVTRALIDDEARVPLLRLAGSDKPGILDKNHASDARPGLSHYIPRAELAVPDAPLYLVLGVERGDEYRDVSPTEALEAIASRGRTPLTIDEGLSLATVAPEILVKNHCFSLAGSTRGDKRVPALWISDGAPKLGWCFDRVPHSWLGLASARERIAA